MQRWRALWIWAGLALAIGLPLILAAFSPLLAWRSAVYIIAGFAGILAMAMLLVQPLLVRGVLPGLFGPRARKVHRGVGLLLVALILLHVGALWQTSPPDVIDALLLRSPTPFSIWGVLAMGAVFATAVLAGVRHKLPVAVWRGAHRGFALLIGASTIIHALLIEGTMETTSKIILCLLVLAATLWGVFTKRPWRGAKR